MASEQRPEALPRLRDMTPAWFSEVLRRAGAIDRDVHTVSFDLVGDFSSQILRARLGYRDEASSGDGANPRSVVLKRTARGRPDRLGESLLVEARCYRELAPEMPARLPRCFFAGLDLQSGRGGLLLEDVALEPTSWRAGPGEEHARLAVAALARVHARFLGRGEELAWVPSFADGRLADVFAERYRAGWAASRALYAEAVPGIGRVGDALAGEIRGVFERLATPATLLHGDAHAENLPLRASPGEPEVVLLDWAGPRLGNPGVDLGFFVPMSFPVEARREAERGLVAHHADAFRAAGGPPSADSFGDYRLGVLRRFTRTVEYLGALSGWASGVRGASQQMVLTRCAQAAVDHRVDELC